MQKATDDDDEDFAISFFGIRKWKQSWPQTSSAVTDPLYVELHEAG